MANSLMIRFLDNDRIFSRAVAAELARVSPDFLVECERAGLLRPGPLPGGGEGYTPQDIVEICRIRRLQQDLGLDLDAIEVVLHMRRRMVEIIDEMSVLEAQMWEREQQMRSEIHRLRRLLAFDATYR
jgi:DNA-binding transcriptional MerR regulator